MKYLTVFDKSEYSTALLIKESALKLKELQEHYQIDWEQTICYSLDHTDKTPSQEIKDNLVDILQSCKDYGVTTLLVCDSKCFKVLTKISKIETIYGSVCECKLGYDFKVILCINYQALFYNPNLQSKIALALNTLSQSLLGSSRKLGEGIIHFEEYPTGSDIEEWLVGLLFVPQLTCDIETTGLTVKEAELLTISFAWNQHEGIAFPITNSITPILKQWFMDYKGTLIFHNGTYDVTHLIHKLFMTDYLDYQGLIQGLDSFSNIEDTKVIAYLATNSCAGNDLKLKTLALEFAGNYGILSEEEDTTKIETDKLLTYNLIDSLSTWFVYNKYKPMMIEDNQLDIYQNIMLPSLRSIIHMQLVGMPMDKDQILKTEQELLRIQNIQLKALSNSKLVKEYEWKLQREAFIKKNEELKVKYTPISNFKTQLNPNSGKQLVGLLYEHLEFDVINTTDSGLPSTDGNTLEALLNSLINQHNLTEEDLS